MPDDLSKLLNGANEIAGLEAEYRALVDGCGLAARVDRGFVVVAGDRRAEMLNGLLTNQVTDLAGAGRHALLLTAKGRVLSDLRVFPRSADMLLDVPRRGIANLLDAFNKYLPPIYATFEDASDELGQLGAYGPKAAEAIVEFWGDTIPEEHLAVAEGEVDGQPLLLVRNRRLAADGFELIAPRAGIPKLAERLLAAVAGVGGRPVGATAMEVVRVESGLPAYGIDMGEENLAQETGLEGDAISYDKGCYLGQEVVARVHFRGHVNRRLCGLEFDTDGTAPGTALYDGEKEVGQVTSALRSPQLGPIGLGYVRREIEPPAELRQADGAAGGAVRVVDLPFRRPGV